MANTKYYEVHSRTTSDRKNNSQSVWRKEKHFFKKSEASAFSKLESNKNKNRIYLLRTIDSKDSINYLKGKKLL